MWTAQSAPTPLKLEMSSSKTPASNISIKGAQKAISVISWDVMWASLEGKQVLLGNDHTELPGHLFPRALELCLFHVWMFQHLVQVLLMKPNALVPVHSVWSWRSGDFKVTVPHCMCTSFTKEKLMKWQGPYLNSVWQQEISRCCIPKSRVRQRRPVSSPCNTMS